MNRICIAAAAFSAFGIASLATAADTVSFSDGPGDLNGGIFNAVTGDYGSFMTFCIEYNEFLSMGPTYDYDVSTFAAFNGGGFGNQDPLDSRTAYIYQTFRNGNIGNIISFSNDTEMANAIQIALWSIEQEVTPDFSSNPAYANAQLLIAAAQNAIDNNIWSGIGNVRVMNNWIQGQAGTEQGARQDTLIIIPLPTSSALAGLGLIGLSTVRRRK